jgi:hypothetical protein
VLVGGAVEDNVGVVVGEDLMDAGGVGDVGDDGVEAGADPALEEFLVDFEEGVFGLFEEDEFAWAEAEDLAADFGADGAAGTGDEDGFAGEEALEFGGVQVDGGTAEEGVYGDFLGRGSHRGH